MRVEEVSRNGSQVVLRVVADAGEYHEAARRGVRAFLLQAGAPVPDDDRADDILLQIIGADADLAAAKRGFAADYLVPRAILQAGVMPVCSPDFAVQAGAADEDSFEIDLKVFSKPQMDLTGYGPVDIEVDAPRVTEAEVDAQVLSLVRQRTPELVKEVGGMPVKPAIDDAWVAANVPDDAVSTVEQMRDAIRRAGEQQKRADFESYKLSVAAAAISERLSQDVPDDIVDAMAASMMGELRAQAAGQGVGVDEVLAQHGMTEAAMEERARAEAEGMLRQGLALDAVFRHEGLAIEEQDRVAALHAIAPGAEDDAREQLVESGYSFTIEETAQRMRAGRWVLEHAKVTVRA